MMQHPAAAPSTVRAFATREIAPETQAGSPEARWSALLQQRPIWSPRIGPLIVVSPHPDDEVLGAGGLIHSWTASGWPVTVVSVTDGEAAFPGWRGLDLIRRDELKGALRKLCATHVGVYRVGIPDGNVARHANRLRNALLALIEPGATLIAPYEHDGHPDHEAVGEVCRNLSRSHGVALARYPVWTWQHADSSALEGANWGRFLLSMEARRAKARALQCFASQLQPTRESSSAPPRVLAHFERPYEAFLL